MSNKYSSKDKKKKWVVCLGGEDWWYHSHGHFDIQVMKRLAKTHNVLYVCSIGMRMPSVRHDQLFWTRLKRKLRSVAHSLKRVGSSLFIYSPLPFPFYGNRYGRALNRLILGAQLRSIYRYLNIYEPLVWVNTPTAWPIISSFSRIGLVYQRTDDYAAYDFENFNAEYVKKIDIDLMKIADLVIHVSEELHNEALKYTCDSILVTQGVDERFFKNDATKPSDLSKIPSPLVGYIGGMDGYKFDTYLIEKVAKKLSNVSFVLIGHPNPNTEPLIKFNNIYFLGMKSHSRIPAYVHNFDVCIVPTAQTEWGLKCRPLKLMEYLAAEKPIVATPTPASNLFRDVVSIAADVDSWVKAIIKILDKNEETSLHYRLPSPLESWDSLAKRFLLELINRGITTDVDTQGSKTNQSVIKV